MAGDPMLAKLGPRAVATNTGTNSGVSATQATPGTSKALVCLSIQCSSDAAALVTIESPANTVLWQQRFAGAFALAEEFPFVGIVGASNQAMLVKVSASTAHCEANIVTAQIGA